MPCALSGSLRQAKAGRTFIPEPPAHWTIGAGSANARITAGGGMGCKDPAFVDQAGRKCVEHGETRFGPLARLALSENEFIRNSSAGLFLHGHRSRRVGTRRSEEHTSELQSRLHLVCRLLLEKKKKK